MELLLFGKGREEVNLSGVGGVWVITRVEGGGVVALLIGADLFVVGSKNDLIFFKFFGLSFGDSFEFISESILFHRVVSGNMDNSSTSSSDLKL